MIVVFLVNLKKFKVDYFISSINNGQKPTEKDHIVIETLPKHLNMQVLFPKELRLELSGLVSL